MSEWRHWTDRKHQEVPPDVAVDPGIRASWPGARLVGPAFTVRGVCGDNLALHRAVAAAPSYHVLVADLDGGVRDRDALRSLNFPVFSRHDSVRGTGKQAPGQA